jgi:hypothetical protein
MSELIEGPAEVRSILLVDLMTEIGEKLVLNKSGCLLRENDNKELRGNSSEVSEETASPGDDSI